MDSARGQSKGNVRGISAKRWTDKTVQNLKVPESGRVDYSDPSTIGLFLSVSARGLRTWRFFYRFGVSEKGTPVQRRDLIGHYPMMSLADARAVAQRWHRLACSGTDPRALEAKLRKAERVQELAARQAADARERNTFAQARNDFLARCEADGLRQTGERRRHFSKYLPAHWSERPVDSITRDEILALWTTIEGRHGPVMANRVIETLRAMFGWLESLGRVERNPARKVRRKRVETERERVLSDAELAAIWRASEELGQPWRTFVRLLILTGQRRSEVSTLRWRDLDLEQAVWDLRPEVAKMGRPHRVPLSDMAISELEALPRYLTDGEHDFVLTTTRGRRPIAALSQLKVKLDKAIADAAARGDGQRAENWWWHDIRRTVASGMARLSVPPYVCEKVLGHEETIRGVARIYNRFDYGDEKRNALYLWSQHVFDITGHMSRVVALEKRA